MENKLVALVVQRNMEQRNLRLIFFSPWVEFADKDVSKDIELAMADNLMTDVGLISHILREENREELD